MTQPNLAGLAAAANNGGCSDGRPHSAGGSTTSGSTAMRPSSSVPAGGVGLASCYHCAPSLRRCPPCRAGGAGRGADPPVFRALRFWRLRAAMGGGTANLLAPPCFTASLFSDGGNTRQCSNVEGCTDRHRDTHDQVTGFTNCRRLSCWRGSRPRPALPSWFTTSATRSRPTHSTTNSGAGTTSS